MRPLVLLWGCLLLPGCGALTGPKNIRGFEGDTVSILCTYGEKLRYHRKYWCRKTRILFDLCSAAIYAKTDGQENTEGRVSIQDSPQELRFNVTLRALTREDSGEYWCGIEILGFDETLLVSLVVLPEPGPSHPKPIPTARSPTSTGLHFNAGKAKTLSPNDNSSTKRTWSLFSIISFPGGHPQVTTAKQGKTEAEASPLAGTSPPKHTGAALYTGTSPSGGTSPRAGTSLRAATSPYEETSPHKATSPHAGTSAPSTHLDSTWAKDASLFPSSMSKSRVCPTTVRMLAPVLVLLGLLLASGLCALGRYILQWRKKVQLATETQRNEKVHHSHLPLGKGQVPEHAGIRGVEATTGPAARPCTEIQGPDQTLEQEEALFQDPNGEALLGPPLPTSQEIRGSVFVSV